MHLIYVASMWDPDIPDSVVLTTHHCHTLIFAITSYTISRLTTVERAKQFVTTSVFFSEAVYHCYVEQLPPWLAFLVLSYAPS
jgi:hypothetical protein